MVWFFLEALVALLIAVGIVAWTMGPKRRKPPPVIASDTDPDGEDGHQRDDELKGAAGLE